MKKIIGITALLALLSACSEKKSSLAGDWQMTSIAVNGKTQPLDDCTKKTYLSFGKDSIIYHTFMQREDCKEDSFKLAYTASKNSIKVTNETGRIERSAYTIKNDSLIISDTAEMQGQKFTSRLVLVKKK